MSNTTSPGIFMPVIDWSDPQFAEWDISKLQPWNHKQNDLFLSHDPLSFQDDGYLDLTLEQQKQLCLTVSCRVELFHSNVCFGVEKSWPKKLFRENEFQSLQPEQKEYIHNLMQLNGVKLYNKYVNKSRLAKSVRQRTDATLAPYLELNYRKILFERMKALETPTEDVAMYADTDINENVKSDTGFWKKVRFGNGLMYANPFDGIASERDKLWHNQLNQLQSPKAVGRSHKCNAKADKLIRCGDAAYSANKWYEAFDTYNRALCFAEPESTCEGLAYGNRGKCFYQLGLYHDARADFGLAIQKMCPDKFLEDTHGLRADCKKQAIRRYKVKTKVPKMKLPANTKFPCLANVLDIDYIDGYGRGVVANADIGVGQTIFMAETFASVTMANNQAHCYTCHRIDRANYIPCPNCSDVMFCCEKCANNNAIHRMDCRSIYHRIDDINVRFVIHTVLVAIEMFPCVDDLMNFVESCELGRNHDEIPESANDQTSKYELFLKLTLSYDDETLFIAYQAYTCILLMPKIKALFDTEFKERFLMQLIAHHANAITKNVFQDDVDGQYTVEYMYDVLSFINHACAPNVNMIIKDKIGYGVSTRPIKKGEQVFFTYLGEDSNLPTEERQRKIQCTWDFVCKCTKCEDGL